MATLRTETDGPIVALTFDDGRLNVLTLDVVEQLQDAVTSAEADPEVHALALLGREGAFSAGLDGRVLAGGGTAAHRLLASMGVLLLDLYRSRLRVVAGCSGHGVAAGAMLLLVSDARVGAAGKFRIGFSEVLQGMPLPELPVLLARDRLNPRFVQACTMAGRLLAPEDAIDAGFLDRVVAPPDLREAVIAEARTLAAVDGTAYAETLRTVRGPTLDRMTTIVDAVRRGLD